ncbi:MAG TPA: IS1634 family transposase [Stenomitos sp.]
MKASSQIQVQNLDHLGLVAGIIDEIGVVEQVNQLVGQHSCEKVSPGHVVKAMLINGLGFVSAPLYMFPKFFEGKATEHLIGEGVKAEHLNDDRLGRVLDKLYSTGLEQLFTSIALKAVKKYGVSTYSVHLDSSSFHVHGKYEQELPKVTFISRESNRDNPNGTDIEEKIAPSPIEITYGYSRDHRPDLKQFIIDLISSGDGDVPLFLRVADGNEADNAVFAKILCKFREQLTLDSLMVADSALYSAPNLALMTNLKWLCRVPLTINEAKELVSQISEEQLVNSGIEGYKLAVHKSHYGGIEQRWLVVESQSRRATDQHNLQQKLSKSEKEAQKKLKQLCQEKFTCPLAAVEVAQRFGQKLKYYNLTDIQAVEFLSESTQSKAIEGSTPGKISYRIKATLVRDQNVIERETRCAGRFILATNVLEVTDLSNDQMLCEYKAQQSAERGFGFLKDPLFFTDSIFINSPERVEALAMLMGLCLLVYTLGQRQLRQALKQAQSGIKNQLGKLTERPTLRWIFQCFQAVHLLLVKEVKQVSNLTDERLYILRFFPDSCRHYYLLG